MAEMEKQQTNEQLRLAFAEKANALSEYIQQRSTALAEQSMQALGTMEVSPSISLPYLSLSLPPPPPPQNVAMCVITTCSPHTHTPQEQLQALVGFEEETLAQQPEMEAAEEIHRQTQAALIFDNKHSAVTMEVSVTRL